MQSQRIKSVKSIGIRKTLDFEVNHKDHLFFGNNTVIANSHAVSYGVTAAQTVYLKNRYPKEFYLESLKVEQDKQPKKFLQSVAQIITEMNRFGIKLLPPSLTKSDLDFTIEGDSIRFGLSAIKGAGGKAAENIRKFVTNEAANKFEIFNAAKQAGITATVFSGLAEVGALDDYEKDRHLLTLEYRVWGLLNEKEKKYCLEHGHTYKFRLPKMLRKFTEWIGSDGKAVGKESRLNTIRKNSEKFFDLYDENCRFPEISQYLFEKQLIGYSFSHTLRELFKEFGYLRTIAEIGELGTNAPVNFVGTVVDVHVGISKKGNKKISLVMQDETGEMNFLFMGQEAEAYLKDFKEPKEDQIIHIKGSKSDNVTFVRSMSVQHLQIFNRVNDLRKIDEKIVDVSVKTPDNNNED